MAELAESVSSPLDMSIKYLKHIVIPARADTVESDVRDNYEAMINESKRLNGVRPTAGSKILADDMHNHPDAYLVDHNLRILTANLQHFLAGLETGNPVRTRVEKLLSYWYAAISLRQLHRFLDKKQSQLLSMPEGNGENLRSRAVNPSDDESFVCEWNFRRSFIRSLHFPGLVRVQDLAPSGQNRFNDALMENFHSLYQASRLLLELEHDEVDAEYSLNSRDPRSAFVGWIEGSRKVVEDGLDLAFQTAKVPQGDVVRMARDAQPPMSVLDILTANIQRAPIALTDAIQNQLHRYFLNHPYERLLLDILDKKNTFERLLGVEHVDDKLMNKQISILDEEDVVHGTFSVDQVEELLMDGNDEEYVFQVLHDIAFVNRQRRNFRLFKDWALHRPWRTMFQFYDSSHPETQWAADAIHQFRVNTQNLRDHFGPGSHPTDYIRITPKLFGVIPINLATEPLPENRQACKICHVQFTAPPPSPPGSHLPEGRNHLWDKDSPLSYTATVLHCGHICHTLCIFRWWDRPGAYLQQCPICSHIAALNFKLCALDPFDYYPVVNLDGTNNNIPGNFFAHNTFAHHWAQIVFADPKAPASSPTLRNLATPTPDEERLKNSFLGLLYNLPSSATDVSGLIEPNLGLRNQTSRIGIVKRLAAEYWVRENMACLAYQDQEIKWRGMFFEPGVPASMRIHQGKPEIAIPRRSTGVAFNASGNLANEGVQAFGRTLGQQWMEARYVPGGPPGQGDVYDLEMRRILNESRADTPWFEAAVLRKRRRERNAKRRAELVVKGLGFNARRMP